VSAYNNLAWLLATCPDASVRDGAKAIELAQQAVKLSGGKDPGFLDTLAAAYAEAGHFFQAVETARKALVLAKQQKQQLLVHSLRARIALYEAGKPFRER
jgi:tetratricopeptide (TPR) repeat protein